MKKVVMFFGTSFKFLELVGQIILCVQILKRQKQLISIKRELIDRIEETDEFFARYVLEEG